MSRRMRFLGMAVALLCLALVVSGCLPVGSAVQTEEIQPATPMPEPTATPTPEPTATSTPEPTAMPTPEPTAAPAQVEVARPLDAARGELPEGVAIDKSGNIYVSMGYPFWFEVEESFGEIWKIGPDGQTTVLAAFPSGPAPAGLAVDPAGVLYFAYPNPMDPGTNGVYRLAGEGEPERLPGSENIALSNGLALTQEGDLYVSDSAGGAVWRIPSGGEAENWLQHEWLAGCADIPGANGVALWKDSLYVANTGLGLLVRVPILDDGTAGEPEIVAGDSDCDPENDELFSMDGIALDVHGNVFALLVVTHKLVRIDPGDGSHTVLLTDADGLYNPASIAFGTSEDDNQYVFLTNYALLPPAPANSLGPGVLKYNVGVAGLPLP